MAQTSYFHNGVARGDAVEAPYSADLYASLTKTVLATEGSYVLPDVDNMLIVAAGAGRTVTVGTGAAFFDGRYYQNTAAVTLDVTPNTSGKSRIDRVVLRYDASAQTIRLAVRNGVPGDVPNIPDLISTDDIKEMSLARIYLLTGFAAIAAEDIIDERNFANNVLHQNNYSLENLMFNSDWMVFSGEDPAGTVPPDGWVTTSTAATIVSAERLDEQRRGRSLDITLDATKSIYTTVLTTENPATNLPFTFLTWVHVTEGMLKISFAGQGRYVYPSSGVVPVIIRATTTGYQTIQLYTAAGCSFKIGTTTLAFGYIPALSENVDHDEVVLFDYLCQSRADEYKGAANMSTSTTELDLTDFGKNEDYMPVMPGFKALIARLWAYDSGSAAVGANCYAELTATGADVTYLRTELRGVPNSIARSNVGYVLVWNVYDQATTYNFPPVFELNLVASGAGTMRVGVEFIGAVI